MKRVIQAKALDWARLSLSFLWLLTGLSSLWLSPNIGYAVLARGGITGPLAELCLWSGSLLDISIGLWLLAGIKLRLCYQLQLGVIVVYSLLLSLIAPEFWIHPFGPLSKNLPILVLIFYCLEMHPNSLKNESERVERSVV
ncbi:DoxX-like family protein [Saccharospirillum impatiens]|uniref:DoxX-like family protein n=1 Tax=Saccharospirillum impatiens TaxID=169438 RepID=UPI000A0015FD|nr:DoxX-like family protein [Saccharospirillum impatiens]